LNLFYLGNSGHGPIYALITPKFSFGYSHEDSLLEIMLRNRCWPTTFRTITTGDANRWCLNMPV
jgi:hypothetical protein